MEQFFSVAGVTWRVVYPEGIRWECPERLAQFAAHAETWDHTLEFRFCGELPEPEGEELYRDPEKCLYRAGDARLQYRSGYLCLRRRGNHTLVHALEAAFGGSLSARAVLYAMELEHQLALRDGVILHASWIRRGERGILFTAPSGVGKSTQAELWRSLRGAELMNGDRAAVFAGEGQMPCVRGIPISGSSPVCKNAAMPPEAIVCLSQAPKTSITRLTGFRAFRQVWEGCAVGSLEREAAQRCLETVSRLLERVPVYHLACTPDESAVLALENMLKQEGASHA